MKKDLVLLGTGASLRHAPLNDASVEFWGPGYLAPHVPHLDRAFEIHIPAECQSAGVWEVTKSLTMPVMMIHEHPDVPTSVRYPLEEVARRFTPPGRVKPYLTSVADYMLAYALLLDPPPASVSLFGLDMNTGTEYEQQQKSCEFWLGVLFGRGIPFTLAPTSDMLKVKFLYGIEQRAQEAEIADLVERLAWYRLKRDQAEAALRVAGDQREQLRGTIATIERDITRAQR